VQERPGRLPVGIPGVDRLLGGGLPIGALSEVTGSISSGRTSLALALLAATTARGELAAWVDAADAFDPPSARGQGVDLDRVLWVRASGWHEALCACERIVRTEGFPLVLLDGSMPATNRGKGPAAPSESTWLRLTRLLASSHATLLLLSHQRLAGAHAALAIEMQPARARFSGRPALLDELETRMTLVRNRTGPVDPQSSHPVRALSTSERRIRPPRESAA
jgi:hypothetical protein